MERVYLAEGMVALSRWLVKCMSSSRYRHVRRMKEESDYIERKEKNTISKTYSGVKAIQSPEWSAKNWSHQIAASCATLR